MNPSYVRLQVVQESALPLFSAWLDLPELEPPRMVSWDGALDAAIEDGDWRSTAFFLYESDGWTMFEYMTGYLGTKTTHDWLRLAAQDFLVFAGYNDAVPYAELIVVLHGQVVREFRDDEQDPSQNVNRGRLDFEGASPIDRWVEAAAFVDRDELAVLPEQGMLIMFHIAA